jgi:DNA-binding CsgD family transcriptional regulator
VSDEIPIPESYVRQIVRLLGEVANLRGQLSVKRRALMTGLAAMVHADAWAWIVSRAADDHNNPAVASFLYGGLNGEQFARYARVMQDREKTPVEYRALNRLRLTQSRFTRGWDQLVTAEEWYSPGNRELLASLGFEHVLYSVKVLDDDGLFSGITLKRRMGRSNFTPMERRIVHIVTGEIDWLHYDERSAEVSRKVRPLRPRLRIVLTMLVDGNSIPDTARKLGLSQHTVKDYAKEIYGHFKVNSRAGLLRHFMVGDGGDIG